MPYIEALQPDIESFAAQQHPNLGVSLVMLPMDYSGDQGDQGDQGDNSGDDNNSGDGDTAPTGPTTAATYTPSGDPGSATNPSYGPGTRAYDNGDGTVTVVPTADGTVVVLTVDGSGWYEYEAVPDDG